MTDKCTICNQATSTPLKFLLCCIQCNSFWHHRCHKPPVSDKELIQIIKHYNIDKQRAIANPTFVWRCRTCNDDVRDKGKRKEIVIDLVDSDDDTPAPKTTASSSTTTIRPSGIRIIDDPFPTNAPPLIRAQSSTSLLTAGLDDLHLKNQSPTPTMGPPALPSRFQQQQRKSHVRISSSLPPITALVVKNDMSDNEEEEEEEIDEIEYTPAPPLLPPRGVKSTTVSSRPSVTASTITPRATPVVPSRTEPTPNPRDHPPRNQHRLMPAILSARYDPSSSLLASNQARPRKPRKAKAVLGTPRDSFVFTADVWYEERRGILTRFREREEVVVG